MKHKRCTATHPDKPNFDGKARGRKLHLSKNEEKTFCNMLVDKYVEGVSLDHYLGNGKCKICFQGDRKEKYQDTFTKLQRGKSVTITE